MLHDLSEPFEFLTLMIDKSLRHPNTVIFIVIS